MNIDMKIMRYILLATVLISAMVFASCVSSDPEVTREDLDRAIGTLEAKVDANSQALADINEAVSEMTATDSARVSRTELQKAVTELRADIAAEDQAVRELEVGSKEEPEPVSTEEVFADIFQNATKVDRLSIDDIRNCRVVSEYEVELGDMVSVEVALARKEDSRSRGFDLQPYFTRIKDSSDDGVPRNEPFENTVRFYLDRTINNLWNELNTGPYMIAVYRGKRSMAHDPSDANFVVGEWDPRSGALIPGVYRLSLADENVNVPSSSRCSDMLKFIDVTNLLPESVLIAWYVN